MSDDQWLPTAHVGTAQTIFDSCLLLYNAKICKDSNWEAAWRHGWYHPRPQELQSRGLWKVSYRCSSQGIVNERDHGKGPKVHSARWFWRIQVRRLLSAWKHNAFNAFNAFKKCLSALFPAYVLSTSQDPDVSINHAIISCTKVSPWHGNWTLRPENIVILQCTMRGYDLQAAVSMVMSLFQVLGCKAEIFNAPAANSQ